MKSLHFRLEIDGRIHVKEETYEQPFFKIENRVIQGVRKEEILYDKIIPFDKKYLDNEDILFIQPEIKDKNDIMVLIVNEIYCPINNAVDVLDNLQADFIGTKALEKEICSIFNIPFKNIKYNTGNFISIESFLNILAKGYEEIDTTILYVETDLFKNNEETLKFLVKNPDRFVTKRVYDFNIANRTKTNFFTKKDLDILYKDKILSSYYSENIDKFAEGLLYSDKLEGGNKFILLAFLSIFSIEGTYFYKYSATNEHIFPNKKEKMIYTYIEDALILRDRGLNSLENIYIKYDISRKTVVNYSNIDPSNTGTGLRNTQGYSFDTLLKEVFKKTT